jgi:hypothetical protein
MKVPGSMLVLLLFALCASAQAQSNVSAGPEVTVLEKKWRMDVRNPALEKDPLTPNQQREQEVAAQKEDARANENRVRMGEPTLPPRVRVAGPETGRRRLSVTYIYEVKVRNTGMKEIRTLTWEYEFLEPGTEQVVGRLRIVSKVSISPGKTRNVIVRTTSPPTETVDATKAGKKSKDQYSERVVIQSVSYADGSVWQAPSN